MSKTAQLLFDPLAGTEITELTETAHRAGIEALTAAPVITAPVQIVYAPETGLAYALDVRGQWSATGHGKTGFDPHRGALYEALNEKLPVRLSFLDGTAWKTAWMAELGEAKPISQDPTRKRFGWDAGRSGPFTLSGTPPIPTSYDPKPPLQARLGEEG